jgi:hypothetical protein
MPATADPRLTHAHLRARVLQLEAGNAAAARLHAELADAAARRVFGTNLPSHMHTTQLEEVGRVEEALLIAPAWKAAGQHHKQVWTRHISLLLARGQDAEAGTWLGEVQEDDHLSDTQRWIWKTRTLGPDAAALDMPDLKRRYDSPELSGVHTAALWLHLRRPERCQTQAREFLARHREMLTRLPNHNALYIAEFLAGERTADRLLESAGGSRVARCNNRFYIGWQCWAREDAAAARREWQAVVATGLYDLSTHRFAKILLAEKWE